MKLSPKQAIEQLLAVIQPRMVEADQQSILQKNSVALFSAFKGKLEETEEVFKDENLSRSLYNAILQSNIQSSEIWVAFVFELVKCAYDNKRRQYMQIFVKSLIPTLLSIYTLKYYQEFNNIKDKGFASEEPLDINVFGGLLIEIYNMELENAKKLEISQSLTTFKQLKSFHDKYEKSLQDSQKQGEELQQKQVVYEKITSINPQQHLILCEMLIRIYCVDLDRYFTFAIPHFLRLIYIVTGVSLDFNEIKSEGLIQLFKIQQVQTFLVRITAPAMQDIIFALFQILVCHKSLKRDANYCLDLMFSKTCNESQFKLADMCQSVIELTRDEYDEIYTY